MLTAKATHSTARANRNNQADLGDVIKVANRTGNGVALLVAWLYQLFFNVSPWLVQVTVLDGLNATATLRWNGHQIDEVSLQLQFGDVNQDNHRKLLSMGASFAAMGVAAKYYDIKGFYGVETWRSAAYVSLAIQTVDEERRIYIERALAEEPSNLVAECEEVADAFDDETDADMLWNRMDRLEPMIDVAARLCGESDVLGVPGSLWHQTPARPTDDRPAKDEFDRPEPPLMMLRLIDWYLGSVSNWIALKLASDGGSRQAMTATPPSSSVVDTSRSSWRGSSRRWRISMPNEDSSIGRNSCGCRWWPRWMTTSSPHGRNRTTPTR